MVGTRTGQGQRGEPLPRLSALCYLSLLEIASVFHGLGSNFLALLQRLVNGDLPGNSRRDLLRNVCADALKLRDADELHTDIRNLVAGRIGWVSRLDGLQRDLGKRFGGLQVLRILVGRFTSPWWDRLPAIGLADQFDVVLAGGPGQEL